MILKTITAFLMQTWLLPAHCFVFLLLNILDGHSTWLVVRPDHYERERNPIARWVFRKLRLPRAIPLFKALLLLILAFVIWHWRSDKVTLNIALSIGNVLFIFVVWHNYKVYRRIKRPFRYQYTNEYISHIRKNVLRDSSCSSSSRPSSPPGDTV